MLRYVKNKEFWAITLTFAFLLLVIYFSAGHIGKDNLIGRGVHRLFAPAQNVVDSLRSWIGDYSYVMADKQAMEDKISALQQEVNDYKQRSLGWEENRAELVRLQAMLDISAQYLDTASFINARVIARSPNTWDQFITVDRGSEQGVSANMPVITPDGLVGIVMNVNAKTSQVYLITDREIAVGVIVQPDREARGIVEGMGSAQELHMENIPYYSEIQVGDMVVTSGLSEIYPKGIRIGTVKALYPEGNGLVMTATVAPFVDFDRLEEVMLIQGYPPNLDFTETPAEPEEEPVPEEEPAALP